MADSTNNLEEIPRHEHGVNATATDYDRLINKPDLSVYITDDDVTQDTTANKVVQRDSNGEIQVPDSPSDTDSAINVNYYNGHFKYASIDDGPDSQFSEISNITLNDVDTLHNIAQILIPGEITVKFNFTFYDTTTYRIDFNIFIIHDYHYSGWDSDYTNFIKKYEAYDIGSISGTIEADLKVRAGDIIAFSGKEFADGGVRTTKREILFDVVNTTTPLIDLT